MKHTFGEHYDAWNRFIRWYWKYTIKPRFTNIPRRIHYYLRRPKKNTWGAKHIGNIFYGEGQMLEETRGGYNTQSFKEWWKDNAGFESRDGTQKKRAALKKHLAEMRRLIKKL